MSFDPWSILGEELEILRYATRSDAPIVALDAIWALYASGRAGGSWKLLGELGLDEETFEPYFDYFNLHHVTSERGRLRSHRQRVHFLQLFPSEERQKVLHAVALLLYQYKYITKGSDDEDLPRPA